MQSFDCGGIGYRMECYDALDRTCTVAMLRIRVSCCEVPAPALASSSARLRRRVPDWRKESTTC